MNPPQIDPDFIELKTIRSHLGISRIMAEMSDEPAGWVRIPDSIPSPFSFGSARPVFAWGDHFALVIETSQRCYRVFSVAPRLVQNTEQQVYDQLDGLQRFEGWRTA